MVKMFMFYEYKKKKNCEIITKTDLFCKKYKTHADQTKRIFVFGTKFTALDTQNSNDWLDPPIEVVLNVSYKKKSNNKYIKTI